METLGIAGLEWVGSAAGPEDVLNYMIAAAACVSLAIAAIDYVGRPRAERHPRVLSYLMALRWFLIVVGQIGAYAAIFWFVRELVISRQ
jgi:NO-binding membrane sensor protein with MHYT domain